MIRSTSVVFVDDEANNGFLFKMTMPSQYTVNVFADPTDALQFIKNAPPMVIVSDEDMPTLRGLDMMREARRFAPESLRMIVTGKVDIASLQERAEANLIHFFVGKPYDPNFIVKRIAEFFGDAPPGTIVATLPRDGDEQRASQVFEAAKSVFAEHRSALGIAERLASEIEDKGADLFMQLGSAINYNNFRLLLSMSFEEGHTFEQFLEIYWRFNDIKKGKES